MEIDKDLASIHAYLCADGYVIKNPPTQKYKYYKIGLRNTNLVLLKDFQEKFEKVFGIKPRLVEGQRCEIGSKEIYWLLNKEFGSFYSREWQMPLMRIGLLPFWLRSFFDCEGWATCKSHQDRHIGLESVNRIGLEKIGKALNQFGIKSKIKKRNDRDIFSLKIFGKENLIRFREKINFLHPSKKEKLRIVTEDFVNYYWQFPKKQESLVYFVKRILKMKGKIRRNDGIFVLISNKEENLKKLQKELNRLFSIPSRIRLSKNGIGTSYFQLRVDKKDEVIKFINKNLINKEEKEKWLKLRK